MIKDNQEHRKFIDTCNVKVDLLSCLLRGYATATSLGISEERKQFMQDITSMYKDLQKELNIK